MGQTTFDEALREAINARGLPLDRLLARLRERGIRVSLASLSNWQRGRCRPESTRSLEAVNALEEILGLPPQRLATLLGPPRPRGRWLRHVPGSLPYRKVCPVPGSLDRLLAEVRPALDGQLRFLGYHEEFRVGPDKEEHSVHTRAILQAARDGIDRHIAIYHNELGRLPRLSHIDGCRLGTQRSDPRAGLTVAELVFDHQLREGETYVIEYRFSHESGPQTTYYQRWLRFPTGQYVLKVTFDAAARPRRCMRFFQESLSPEVCKDRLGS